MNVHLIYTKDVTKELFQQVYNLLLSVAGPLIFRKHEPLKRISEQVIPWEYLFSACNQFRRSANIADEDFVVLLTSNRNTANWFSAYDPKGTNSIFIHAAEWENYLDCAPEFPLAYEVVENILERLMFADFDEMVQATHDPPIGCILDMCSWKPDILYKLRTADICHNCLSRLDARGVDPELVGQVIEIIENIRPNVLFSSSRRKHRENDEALPFPVAITRRKMNLASQPLHKFLCLIDHFDSLIRTSVIVFGNIILGKNFSLFYQEQGLSGRPSLGHWVTALTKLAKQDIRTTQPELNLPDDIPQRFQRIIGIEQQEHIVQMRNERRGHGYLECYEQTYRNDFEDNIEKLIAIEEILRPLFSQYSLFYVDQSDHREEFTFSIRVKKLMGSHPDFLEDNILLKANSIQELPVSHTVYIANLKRSQWHNLSPYIVYGHCPSCAHPRVLISDGADLYLDPYIGHRVTI